MLFYISLLILLISPVMPKPRYAELDDEEQHLFRAAYETPSYDTPPYDQDDYGEEEDMQLGKFDLLKDGLWAIKAKLKELKAFNKALAANLLSTKLKVKELLAHQLLMKKHTHEEKKKPYHNYQPQPYPVYEPPAPAPQYAAPQYGHDPYYGH